MKDSDDSRRAATDRAGMPADPDVLPVYAVMVDAVTGDWIGQPVPTGRQTTARDWAGREDTGHEHYRIHVHPEAGDDALRALILQWVFH